LNDSSSDSFYLAYSSCLFFHCSSFLSLSWIFFIHWMSLINFYCSSYLSHSSLCLSSTSYIFFFKTLTCPLYSSLIFSIAAGSWSVFCLSLLSLDFYKISLRSLSSFLYLSLYSNVFFNTSLKACFFFLMPPNFSSNS